MATKTAIDPNCRSSAGINEVSRRDFFAPSSRLFDDHCRCIVGRYRLGEKVHRANARDIVFTPKDESGGVFTIKTDVGTYRAKIVVLAVGPGHIQNLPDVKRQQDQPNPRGWRHCMEIKDLPEPTVHAKIIQRLQTNVVVVGGGLSSIQIADLAVRRGISKVWIIARGKIKVKPFDIDLAWLSEDANIRMQQYWAAGSDEGEFVQRSVGPRLEPD